MSERTWSDIGNEIRDDYLRADGPENINFREVQWDVWLAEVEREAEARALEKVRSTIGAYQEHGVWAFDQAVACIERARAAEIREGEER